MLIIRYKATALRIIPVEKRSDSRAIAVASNTPISPGALGEFLTAEDTELEERESSARVGQVGDARSAQKVYERDTICCRSVSVVSLFKST